MIINKHSSEHSDVCMCIWMADRGGGGGGDGAFRERENTAKKVTARATTAAVLSC